MKLKMYVIPRSKERERDKFKWAIRGLILLKHIKFLYYNENSYNYFSYLFDEDPFMTELQPAKIE